MLTLSKVGPVTNNSDATSCVPVNYAIDTVKSVGAVTANGPTEFVVPYTVQVANLSSIADPNVQLVDNLNLTFADGTPEITVSNYALQNGPCTINAAYNGTSDIKMLAGTDTLAPGESCEMTFNVTLTYAAVTDVPKDAQLNTVLASSTSTGPNPGHTYGTGGAVEEPFNVLAVDASTDSPTLPTAPNDDTPVPTPVVLSVVVIDVVKKAGTVTTVDATHYKVPYTLIVGNTGTVDAPNVQVVDNLALTFQAGTPEITVSDLKVAAGACTANTAFNGVSDIKTLAGTDTLKPTESCTITFTASVAYKATSDVPTTVQNNIALASAVSTGPNPGHTYTGETPVAPTNTLSQDTSTDANELPTTPHGDTTTPSPVAFMLANTGLDQLIVALQAGGVVVAAAAAVAVRRMMA